MKYVGILRGFQKHSKCIDYSADIECIACHLNYPIGMIWCPNVIQQHIQNVMCHAVWCTHDQLFFVCSWCILLVSTNCGLLINIPN